MLTKKDVWGSETCVAATRNGHIDCLIYMHYEDCPRNENICFYASQRGHLECLGFAYQSGYKFDANLYFTMAYFGNHYGCMAYIIANAPELEEQICCESNIDLYRAYKKIK